MVFGKLFGLLFKLFGKTVRDEGKHSKICNLKESPSDSRDLKYSAKLWFTAEPDIKYLNDFEENGFIPEIKHQGSIGSCGSNAIATAMEICYNKYKPDWSQELSELFHYYVVRDVDYMNSLPKDSGQYLRDGLKAAQKVGLTPEKLCPYIYTNYNNKPSAFAYSFASWWRLKAYRRAYSIDEIKNGLVAGFPIGFGIKVHPSFMTCKKDVFVDKADKDEKVVGGHAMVIVGFDDEKKLFRVVNSWGTMWGKGGKVWLGYDYIKENLLDAWVVEI